MFVCVYMYIIILAKKEGEPCGGGCRPEESIGDCEFGLYCKEGVVCVCVPPLPECQPGICKPGKVNKVNQ